MGTYLLLKHYRRNSGPDPLPGTDVPMDRWTEQEVADHLQFMDDFADTLRERGEFVDGQALQPGGHLRPLRR